MKLIFLGPPGAGKGTIAAMVSKEFGIGHISTGDMLRNEIKNGTELGLAAKSYIDVGQLVPDAVIVGMVKNRLYEKDCERGFILDGFPRTTEQGIALDEIIHLDAVINFEANDAKVVDRISGRRVCKECGEVHHVSWLKEGQITCNVCEGALVTRHDDNEETVKKRLAVYVSQTSPLIAYYEQKGVLYNTDATVDVQTCFDNIVDIIEKL